MNTVFHKMVCTIAFVATTAAFSAVIAVAEPPSVEFVAATLRQQELATGPSLEVEYVFGIPDGATAKPGTGRMSIHYIRTPGVRFVETKAEVYSQLASWDPVFTAITSYNRSTREFRALTTYANKNDKTMGVIGQGDAPGPFGKVEYMETANYWMIVTPIMDGVTHGTVSQQPEDIDGCACWKITVPGEAVGMKASNTIYVWVDQDIGMCPRRIDSVYQDSNGAQTARVRFVDYEQPGARVWFPKQMILTVDTPNGTPEVSCCKVKRAAVGRVVPEAETRVEFPTGTLVRVLPLDAIYTVP